MIQLEGIQKRFGVLEVIPSLDLTVRRQEWLGVFGHNGSGKTTLIRIAARSVQADRWTHPARWERAR